MPRFKSSPWWALILTLCLGCAVAASWTTTACAELHETVGHEYGNGGGAPPPGQGGDPDIPLAGKKARPAAVVQSGPSISNGRAVGDDARVESVMMWHFRVVLQSLKLWGFARF